MAFERLMLEGERTSSWSERAQEDVMLSMPLHWSYHDPYNHHSQQNLQLLFDPSSGMTLTLTSELKSVTILVTPTPYPTKTVDYDRSRLRPRSPAATLHRSWKKAVPMVDSGLQRTTRFFRGRAAGLGDQTLTVLVSNLLRGMQNVCVLGLFCQEFLPIFAALRAANSCTGRKECD